MTSEQKSKALTLIASITILFLAISTNTSYADKLADGSQYKELSIQENLNEDDEAQQNEDLPDMTKLMFDDGQQTIREMVNQDDLKENSEADSISVHDALTIVLLFQVALVVIYFGFELLSN